jgi:ubiquinone/menaquinone biosynthesis C-methylase UbiE
MNPATAEHEHSSQPLERIESLLRCPLCRSSLKRGEQGLSCGQCGAIYSVEDGIPLLARIGGAETWGEAASEADSGAYQKRYQEMTGAAEYNLKYRAQALKRSSTRREFKLLNELLGSQGRSEILLDLPSGGGRLSPALAPHADLIIEADIALGQSRFGMQDLSVEVPQVWMTASAFHIPLEDRSVDGAVSCRLCHHLPTPCERERLVHELLRVSRRFVVMTFFDYHSVKNILRRARRPFNHKPPKMTMTRVQVAELARKDGAELVACPPLSRLFSGHRYALMVRPGEGGS